MLAEGESRLPHIVVRARRREDGLLDEHLSSDDRYGHSAGSELVEPARLAVHTLRLLVGLLDEPREELVPLLDLGDIVALQVQGGLGKNVGSGRAQPGCEHFGGIPHDADAGLERLPATTENRGLLGEVGANTAGTDGLFHQVFVRRCGRKELVDETQLVARKLLAKLLDPVFHVVVVLDVYVFEDAQVGGTLHLAVAVDHHVEDHGPYLLLPVIDEARVGEEVRHLGGHLHGLELGEDVGLDEAVRLGTKGERLEETINLLVHLELAERDGRVDPRDCEGVGKAACRLVPHARIVDRPGSVRYARRIGGDEGAGLVKDA